MKKRITALLLSCCLLLSSEPIAIIGNCIDDSENETENTDTKTAEKSVEILLEDEPIDSFYLASDEKKVLTAMADFPTYKYQWQILADQELGLWVNIFDRRDLECEVSVALLQSVLSDSGSTALRCVATDYEGNQVTSNTVDVTVFDGFHLMQAAEQSDDVEAIADADQDTDENDYVTVTIRYLFGGTSGKTGVAAKEYVAKVMKEKWTADFEQKVTSPAVIGYRPWQDTNENGVVDEEETCDSVTITGGENTSNVTIEVYYTPVEVNYTVHYYFQKIYSDEYEDGGSVVRQAFTETTLVYSHLENTELNTKGFYEMYFATEDVAADGSTEVKCYFDRQYYLIRFDCNNGYGTDPIYARYGTTFAVNDPVRYGYTFKGWVEDSKYEDGEIKDPDSVPAVIDAWAETPVYKAQWKEDPSSVSYKVAYWGVSGETKYLLGMKTVDGATAGQTVSGADDLDELFAEDHYSCGKEEHEHTKDCYNHVHDMSCFTNENYKLTDVGDSLSGNDLKLETAMKEAGGLESGYIYVVRTAKDSWEEWPKLYLDGKWYSFDGDTTHRYVYKDLEPIQEVTKTLDGYTWKLCKYYPQLNACLACGLENHTHTDDCRSTDNYLEYDENATDKNVVVKGDNSTVVNVYYNHKQYTLRFYYARSLVNESGETDYQVVGGSTYSFGKDAGSYMSIQNLLKKPEKWGKVEKAPTLSSAYINDPDLIEKYHLTSGVTDSSFDSTYTYYYLEFTAGFGTDISDVWPVDVLEPVKIAEAHKDHGGSAGGALCKYEYAYFSAWNGQYGVRYSKKNSNQTIKGAYQYLDENLIFDKSYTEYANETTVSYLCFWENGADVSWSIPKKFTYKLWVEGLDGEYELYKSFDVYDDSTIDEQTKITLDGFEYEKAESEIINSDPNNGMEEYVINFYYKRQTSKELTFLNYNTTTTETGIPFGTALDEYNHIPTYPPELETGAYEFTGWYTTEDCLENSRYDLDKATMPSNDLMLYAGWKKKTHVVNFYNSLDDLRADEDRNFNGEKQIFEGIEHGNVIGKHVDDPPANGATFIGWFYLDDNGEKCFFSALSTPVKADLKVYAEWRTTETVGYTIYYYLYNNDGNYLSEVAPATTGTAFVNSTKTFKAVAVDKAVPLVSSHSMVIKADSSENVYIFHYVKTDTNRYTVRYVNKVDGTLLEPETVEKNVSDAVVTVRYKPFKDMIPDATQKTLILTADPEQNIITFYYTYSETQTVLTLHYMKQSLPDEHGSMNYVEDTDSRMDIIVPWSANAATSTQTLREIVGFTAAKYAYSTDGEKFDVNSPENTADKIIEVNLKKEGTDVYLYYTRNEVGYTVKYVDYSDAQTNLIAPKTGTAYYGQTVVEIAPEVKAFSIVGNTSYDLVISADENSNVVTFYYRKNNCTIYYVPVVNGKEASDAGWLSSSSDIATTKDDIRGCTARSDNYFTFDGWFVDEECTKEVDYDLSDDGFTLIPQNVDLSQVSCTFYAKFIPLRGNMTLNITFENFENIIEGQKLLLKMKNTKTNEEFYFVVTAMQNGCTLNIDILNLGSYCITVADGLESDYLLTGGENVTVKNKENSTAQITISRNDDAIWLTGSDATEATAQTEGTT